MGAGGGFDHPGHLAAEIEFEPDPLIFIWPLWGLFVIFIFRDDKNVAKMHVHNLETQDWVQIDSSYPERLELL